MIDLSTVTVLAASRNDDSENIIRILVFIIIMAIGMIGNIVKAKTEATEKKKRQEARRAAEKKRKELSLATTGAKSMQGEDDRSLDSLERERSRQPMSLRDSDDQSKPRKRSTYTRGGFGEVLAEKPEKSSLERFIELKNVPVPRSQSQPPSNINSGPQKQVEATVFTTLRGIEGDIELTETEPGEVAAADDSIFDLSLDTVAQAIVYREILDKPLALRDHP